MNYLGSADKRILHPGDDSEYEKRVKIQTSAFNVDYTALHADNMESDDVTHGSENVEEFSRFDEDGDFSVSRDDLQDDQQIVIGENDESENSSTDDDPFVPFSLLEIKHLKSHVRTIGFTAFIQQHLALGTPVLRLFHAFGFPLVCFIYCKTSVLLLFSQWVSLICL